MLVIWEAQFGDFVNGAQVHHRPVHRLGRGEVGPLVGLVMLLPHGYEGAGPEHSSAGSSGSSSCAATTTSRWSTRRPRRRLPHAPPAGEARLPQAADRHDAQEHAADRHEPHLRADGGHFREILDDPAFEGGHGVERTPTARRSSAVVLCSGKIYHELDKRRREIGRDDVAILRSSRSTRSTGDARGDLGRYPKNAELIYVQEEPRNMGSYLFVADRLEHRAGARRTWSYIGRPRRRARRWARSGCTRSSRSRS
jgi:2-oxoglutarate dehydrogenase complex dehydrogenase (E1) component-like enzyme